MAKITKPKTVEYLFKLVSKWPAQAWPNYRLVYNENDYQRWFTNMISDNLTLDIIERVFTASGLEYLLHHPYVTQIDINTGSAETGYEEDDEEEEILTLGPIKTNNITAILENYGDDIETDSLNTGFDLVHNLIIALRKAMIEDGVDIEAEEPLAIEKSSIIFANKENGIESNKKAGVNLDLD